MELRPWNLEQGAQKKSCYFWDPACALQQFALSALKIEKSICLHKFVNDCSYIQLRGYGDWKAAIWVRFLGLFLKKQNYFQKQKEGCRIMQNHFLKLA